MHYFENASENPSYKDGQLCPACQKNISKRQTIFVCVECKNSYHAVCKKIVGSHIERLAKERVWFCSPECNIKYNKEKFVDTEVNPQTNSQSEMSGKIDTLLLEMRKLNNGMIELNDSQNFLNKQFEEIKQKLVEIEEENNALRAEISYLRDENSNQKDIIYKLEANVDYSQQQELNNNLILAGFPDNSNDPLTLTKAVFKSINAVEMMDEIKSAEYMKHGFVKPNNEGQHQNQVSADWKIIIKFNSNESKTTVMLKKKQKKMVFLSEVGFLQKNLENKQIFFRDHLTPFRSMLYREALQLKRDLNCQYVWIKNGTVYFRKENGTKVYTITSRNDLSKIYNIFGGSKEESKKSTST